MQPPSASVAADASIAFDGPEGSADRRAPGADQLREDDVGELHGKQHAIGDPTRRSRSSFKATRDRIRSLKRRRRSLGAVHVSCVEEGDAKIAV